MLGLLLGIAGGVVTWYAWRAIEKRRPASPDSTPAPRLTEDERRQVADLEAQYAKDQKPR